MVHGWIDSIKKKPALIGSELIIITIKRMNDKRRVSLFVAREGGRLDPLTY